MSFPYLVAAEPLYLPPGSLMNQHFGLTLDPEDILAPAISRMIIRQPGNYLRQWNTRASQKDIGSTVKWDKDRFQASLDVQQFKPEEITVKATGDNTITIEGKHEEKPDEHGFISRSFVRRYVLPKNCDINKVESRLSSDGVLTITAPTKQSPAVEHKTIPITQTGQPARQIEQKKEEKSKL